MGSTESKDPRLISREITFGVFQSYVTTIPQHYRQTDGQTRRLAVAILHSM